LPSAGAGEAAAGHHPLHERAREQRSDNVRSSFLTIAQSLHNCPALIVPISFRLLHENKTLKAEIASLQKAE
jgi:hypothetical protein